MAYLPASVLVAYTGSVMIPAGSTGTPLTIANINRITPPFSATVGQSVVAINFPGWYAITIYAIQAEHGEAAAKYVLDEGPSMSFTDGTTPEDHKMADTNIQTVLQSTGYVLFDDNNKTLEMELSNSGGLDAHFFTMIMATYLGTA